MKTTRQATIEEFNEAVEKAEQDDRKLKVAISVLEGAGKRKCPICGQYIGKFHQCKNW